MKRHRFLVSFLVAAFILVMSNRVSAIVFPIGDDMLNVGGYITQTFQYSIVPHANYHQDQEENFNQFLTTLFLEGHLDMTKYRLNFYLSGKVVTDWIYLIKSHDDSWREKEFNKSRSELFVDKKWWQLLQEGYVTWTPQNFYLRVGKQIVSWGEMDFVRIMDQINPLDSRRGFSDVEFESTIIPIPLVRAEWHPPVSNYQNFVSELGIQFVYNPNANFIPDQNPALGSDVGGIWAPSYIANGINFGHMDSNDKEPKRWEPEFGLRIQTLIHGSIITLNGFYGRANSPVEMSDLTVVSPFYGPGISPTTPFPAKLDPKGRPILYAAMVGLWPRQKFVGITDTTELRFLRFTTLGGTTPVLRCEVKYEFGKMFNELNAGPVPTKSSFITSNTLDAAVAIDWKFKVRPINPNAYLTLSLQGFYKRITDYPEYFTVFGTKAKIVDTPRADTWTVTAYSDTNYWNGKLVPSLAYMWDINNKAHFILPKITYKPSDKWGFGLEGCWLIGGKDNASFNLFQHKSYAAFKIKYSF